MPGSISIEATTKPTCTAGSTELSLLARALIAEFSLFARALIDYAPLTNMQDKSAADKREGLFGGTGAVFVWNLLPDPVEPFTAVLGCELEAGGSVGRHSQQRDPEIVICIAGEGVAEISGTKHTLIPGSAVSLPFGETLSLQNTSADRPLRYLIIKARQPPTGERPSLLL